MYNTWLATTVDTEVGPLIKGNDNLILPLKASALGSNLMCYYSSIIQMPLSFDHLPTDEDTLTVSDSLPESVSSLEVAKGHFSNSLVLHLLADVLK